METNNKQRVAIIKSLGIIDILQTRYPLPECAIDEVVERLKMILQDALAEPLRNCEVGTAEEQYVRHTKWCNKNKDYSCAATMCRECFAKWAQTPYESEVHK